MKDQVFMELKNIKGKYPELRILVTDVKVAP